MKPKRVFKPIATLVWALLFCLGASALGLTVNALRPSGLAWVAPFPYERDCPDKLDDLAPTVPAPDAKSLLAEKKVLFIDARPAEDYAVAHLPGALSLPFSFVQPVTPQRVRKLALGKYRRIIVYCDTPDNQLAQHLAAQLKQAGAKRVQVLNGGIAAIKGKNR